MHIYKICTLAAWEETQRTGLFPGMPIDHTDGYIHFST
ncbi:MAG: dihydroorotate dehydrogenase, partial [Rhodospirillales bacterium 12-54-5]